MSGDKTKAEVINALANGARSETDKERQQELWRDLWREVLPLEHWFFIKDESENITPIFLRDNDNIILPAFTDVERANEFAKNFGGEDRVYSSAPGGMLSATDELVKSGVALIVFNPQDEPFAVAPQTLKQLADGYASSGEGQVVGGKLPIPESNIDALAYFSRTHTDDIKAKGALWVETLLLEKWYFVPRGEGAEVQPFAVIGESGPTVLAFTEAQRAAEYAKVRGMGELDAVIGMSPQEAIDSFTMDSAVVAAIQFDPQHGSFFSPIKQLPAMLKIAHDVSAKRAATGGSQDGAALTE